MPMSPRLLRPTSGGRFDPRRIANLEGWWDAADAASVTLDGGRVAAWADKSGKGRNATNSTSGSTQPNYITAAVNGRNALRFVNADTTRLVLGTIAIPNSHTVFGVFTRPTAATHSVILARDTTTDPRYPFLWLNTNTRFQRSNASTTTHGASSTATGTFAVTTRRTATTSVLVRLNGSVLADITTGTGVTNSASEAWSRMGYWASTAGNYMDGDLCEVLFYDRSLSDTEVGVIEFYLAAKWGVTI